MVKLIRISPLLPLIFLFMIQGVFCDGWEVEYSRSHICALKNSTVTMSCKYEYPDGHQIRKVYWNKGAKKGEEPPDLSDDPGYSRRLQYLGDKKKRSTISLSHVTLEDSHMYYCRIITDQGKWTRFPGVTLSVTDLQLESPERVTEGDSVHLTCKSSCKLTDRPTFIWSRNSQRLTSANTGNKLTLSPVRRGDAGGYRCAVDGHTLTSAEVQLNVTYPPKDVSVSISGSAEIVEGDSVSLSCSSDSNPPAEIHWFKGGTFVGSGRIHSISNISSDDSRKYKCKASNTHGEKNSDTVTLKIMYPPRSVSVSVSGSAEIVEGDSVSLICSSDSNPPALNFSWFEENQSSSVGSGQSFSVGQSGRFYCQAHNRLGSRRSDAVTVTVTAKLEGPSTSLYAVLMIALICGVLFLIGIFIFMRRRNKDMSEKSQQQVEQVSGSINSSDGFYSKLSPHNLRRGQSADDPPPSTDSETLKYATIQHTTASETQYENVRQTPDSAERSRVKVNTPVLYSTVK